MEMDTDRFHVAPVTASDSRQVEPESTANIQDPVPRLQLHQLVAALLDVNQQPIDRAEHARLGWNPTRDHGKSRPSDSNDLAGDQAPSSGGRRPDGRVRWLCRNGNRV